MHKTHDPLIRSELLVSLSKTVCNCVTHRELTKYLAESKLVDIAGEHASRWVRIHDAFVHFQNSKGISNCILLFIQKVVHPTRYINHNDYFENIRAEVNKCLAVIGRELTQSGKYRHVDIVSTINEVQKRASLLLQKLKNRQVHHEVLKFCSAELLEDNYFHAVFEATKSIEERIRSLTGLTSDGAALVESAFSLGQSGKAILALNELQNDSQVSEQKGFGNLLKGVFGVFRNTTAHAPKILWAIGEDDALDCLTIVSFIHRKLDKCKIALPQPSQEGLAV